MSIYVLSRFTASRGQNPMPGAHDQLDFYLSTIGKHDDLDKEEKRDEEEEVVMQEDTNLGTIEGAPGAQDIGEEVTKYNDSGSGPAIDAPLS